MFRTILISFFFIYASVLKALVPADILLSGNMVPENEDLYYFIGVLQVSDDNQEEEHYFFLNNEMQNNDNNYFIIRNDSLFSYYSFDYEQFSTCEIAVSVLDNNNQQVDKDFEIHIVDVTGKFDTDGIADAEIAAKYPQVKEGDYIFFNANENREIYKNSGLGVVVNHPNKIFIKGGFYSLIHLRLIDIAGKSSEEQVVITNFLGQVYSNRFRLLGGEYWRLTAEYDAEKGIGSPFYRGCATSESEVDFGHSVGNYGIWISQEWTAGENVSNLSVSDTASHFEIDHLEISDGGFAGMLIKEDNGSHNMDHVYLHHLYIHDIGSEGIYLGSTQSDPQHMFNNLLIERCYIARTGSEALQTGQLGDSCIIRNNVLWGAFDWASPFQRWQDNVAQVGTRQGGLLFENNILIGGGEKFLNVSNSSKAGIEPNNKPMIFQNNLCWSCRGPFGAYQAEETDGATNYEWIGNYWGQFIFNYDVVYPGSSDWGEIILIATKGVRVNVSGNKFDDSRQNIATLWGGGNATLIKSKNFRGDVEAPEFNNLLGEEKDYNYLRWMRWTDTIGNESSFPSEDTNKGEPMVFYPGDVVQHYSNGRTCFYCCIMEHSGKEPGGNSDQYWRLLTWQKGEQIFYYPPDEARLQEGSYYHGLGIGLEDGGAAAGGIIDPTIEPDSSAVLISPSLVESELIVEVREKANLEIYSMDGRKLMMDKISTDPATIFVGNLKPGVYIIRVWNETVQETCRFLKL